MQFEFGRPLNRARRLAAFFKTISVVALAGTLAGCSDDGGGDDNGGSGGGSSGKSVQLADENNYTSTATLMPDEIRTAAGEDLDISWDALTVDMQCHDMEPDADIDKVALVRLRGLTKEQAAARLTEGELVGADIDGYIQYDTAEDDSETSCKLSDLTNEGTKVDLAEEYKAVEENIYILLWGTGTRPGTGARTMVFLRPVAGEVNTEVVAEPACDPDTGEGILDFEATLTQPVEIPENVSVVDWKKLTVDGLGNPIYANGIDRILLAYYEDETPETLEEKILDIEYIATDIWEQDFDGGLSAELKRGRHRDTDEWFPGFAGRSEGTWLLALLCSTCQNPSPLFLTVVIPVAAE